MVGDPQRGLVRETFRELGFGRLQDDLAALAGDTGRISEGDAAE